MFNSTTKLNLTKTLPVRSSRTRRGRQWQARGRARRLQPGERVARASERFGLQFYFHVRVTLILNSIFLYDPG
jgi:hypothetical protein